MDLESLILGNSLNLSGKGLNDDDIVSFCCSPRLRTIRHLNLHRNHIKNKGAKAIADMFGGLTSLDLCDNNIGSEGAQAIANKLGNLTSLNLSGNTAAVKGARAIANKLGNLTSLNLSGNHIGVKGAQAIANKLGDLTSLNLNGNNIRSEGSQAIANKLGHLTSLNLYHNNIGSEGAQAIADKLVNLTSLDLSYNKIGVKGARAIADKLVKLTSLNLRDNKIEEIPATTLVDINALRRHFALTISESKQFLPVLRALIIGQPNAGKSTLFRTLTGQPLSFGQLDRTQGFERATLPLNVSRVSNETLELTLDLMDFGGHSLQMLVHSLFFSGKALYLLVLNQNTTEKDAAFWLDNIRSSINQRDDARLIPVLNPVAENPKQLPDGLLSKLYPEWTQLDVGKAVALDFDIEQDRGNPVNIIKAIRHALSDFPFEKQYRVYVEIAEYIREDLSHLFKKPFYPIEAFNVHLEYDKTIEKLLVGMCERNQIPSNQLTQYRDGLVYYLDLMGVVTFLCTNEDVRPQGWVIVHPDLVQKGLYCLFPPNDALRNADSPVSQFCTQLHSNDNALGFKGVFERSDLLPVAQEQFNEAIPYGGEDGFVGELLEVLSHRKLGTIIPLPSNHYLIPAYIEDFEQSNGIQQAKQVTISWQRAQHAYVFEMTNNDTVRKFPHLLMYQFMVYCRKDKQSPALKFANLGVYTCIESIRPQRFLLRWSGNENLNVELIGLDGKIWCFGFAEDPELTDQVSGLVKEVYDGFSRFYHSTARCKDAKMSRSVPCPGCLEKLIKEKNRDSEVENLLPDKLRNICLYKNAVLMDDKMQSHNQRCAVTLKPYLPQQLKNYLADNNFESEGAIINAETFELEQIVGYTAIIYEFLHDTGLAQKDIDGSPALPALFPGGKLGTTEKTMSNMVCWQQNPKIEKMPRENTCRRAIFHLVNGIPIFRIWANMTNEGKKVKPENYYNQIKQVALEIESEPENLIGIWKQTYPNVPKAKVPKRLHQK
jgi:hypothetical protein